MKTIKQLLTLSKNPHYTLTQEEQLVLDNFLLRKQATRLKKSRKKFSTKSSDKTHVTVRNIVEMVDTYAPDERTVTQDES